MLLPPSSIAIAISALSPVRRRVQDETSNTTANDVHRPQQVVLITDEVEERGLAALVLDHRFIDQPMHLSCLWHVAYANQRRRLSHTDHRCTSKGWSSRLVVVSCNRYRR